MSLSVLGCLVFLNDVECPEVSLSVWSISWMILSVLERRLVFLLDDPERP